jgi:hypothetical protein
LFSSISRIDWSKDNETSKHHTHNTTSASVMQIMDQQGLQDIQKLVHTPVEFSRAISRFVACSSRSQTDDQQGLQNIQKNSHAPIEFSRAISRFVAHRASGLLGSTVSYEQMDTQESADDLLSCHEEIQRLETTPFASVELSNEIAQFSVSRDSSSGLHKAVDTPEQVRPPLSPKEGRGRSYKQIYPASHTRKTTENTKALVVVLQSSNHERGWKPRSESSISARSETTDPTILSCASWDSPTSSHPSIRLLVDDRDQLPVLLENLPDIDPEDYTSNENLSESLVQMAQAKDEDPFPSAELNCDQIEEDEEKSEPRMNDAAIEIYCFLQLRILATIEELSTKPGPELSKIEPQTEDLPGFSPKFLVEESICHDKQKPSEFALDCLSEAPEVLSRDLMEPDTNDSVCKSVSRDLALPFLHNRTRETSTTLLLENGDHPTLSGYPEHGSSVHANDSETRALVLLPLPMSTNREAPLTPEVQGQASKDDVSEGNPGALVLLSRENSTHASKFSAEPSLCHISQSREHNYNENMALALVPLRSTNNESREHNYNENMALALVPLRSTNTEIGKEFSSTENLVTEDREHSSLFEHAVTGVYFREYFPSAESTSGSQMLFSAEDNTCASPLSANLASGMIAKDRITLSDRFNEDSIQHTSGNLDKSPESDSGAIYTVPVSPQASQKGKSNNYYKQDAAVHYELQQCERPQAKINTSSEIKDLQSSEVSLSGKTAPTEATTSSLSWDTVSTQRSPIRVTVEEQEKTPFPETVQENPRKRSSRHGFGFFSRGAPSPRKEQRGKPDVRTPKIANRSRRKVHKISPRSKNKVLRAKIDAFFMNTVPLIQESNRNRPIHMTYSSSAENGSPPKEIRIRVERKARLHELYWTEAKKKRQDLFLLVSEYRSMRHGRKQVNKMMLKADHAAERRMKTRDVPHKDQRAQLMKIKENIQTLNNEGSTRGKRRPPSGRSPTRMNMETQGYNSSADRVGHRRRRSESRSRAEEQRRLSTYSEKTVKPGHCRRRSSSRSRTNENNTVETDHGKAKTNAESRRTSSSRSRVGEKKTAPTSDRTEKHRKRSSSRSWSEKKKSAKGVKPRRSSSSSCVPCRETRATPVCSGETENVRAQRRRSSSRLSFTEDGRTKPTRNIALNAMKLKSLSSRHLLLSANSDEDSDATPPQAFGIARTFSFFEGNE